MPPVASKDVEWVAYRLRKKAERLGRVEARSEAEAIEKACAEFEIPQHERFRISVQRA